jgi:hypothetical protein
VHLHQSLHQRQADSEPALRAVERPFALGEEVEGRGEHLGRDAHAVVLDRDAQLGAVAPAGEDDASAARRELGRVVQQVADRLRDAHRVDGEPQVLRRELDLEGVPLRVDQRPAVSIAASITAARRTTET